MNIVRTYKSSLFATLFSDVKNLIALYNALYGTQLPPNAPIRLVTLENVLFEDIYNDIAFILGGKLIILIEHQSTINENMPLRFLLYIAREYEKLLDPDSKYHEKLLTIPRPEFIVLYNGTEEFPDEKILCLSDAFAKIPPKYAPEGLGGTLELTVRVLNINEGRNQAIVQKCEALKGYAKLIALVRHYQQHMNLEKAVTQASKDCVQSGLLVDFLNIHASEVIGMLTGEFDMERAKKVWQKEYGEAGRKEGREEERQKWQSVVSDQAALIAELQAKLAAQSK